MVTSQINNIELINRSLNGDTNAFGELVAKYQNLIYGLVFYKLHNFTDAEDITQNTFIKAFEKLDQLKDPGLFEHWLKVIANNECKLWRRNQKSAISTDMIESLPFGNSQSMIEWKRNETLADISDALNSLSDDNRLILTLFYLSKLTCREISMHQGISVTAVEKRLSRARQQIRLEMMGPIKDDFSKHRLSESFTQSVLRRLTLFPVKEGWISSVLDGDVEALVIGVKTKESNTKFIKLFMDSGDIIAIMQRCQCSDPIASKNNEIIQSIISDLNSYGILLKEVILYLMDDQQCLARTIFMRDGIEQQVNLWPSDAICLALHVNACIYAESSVIKKEYVNGARIARNSEVSVSDLPKYINASTQNARLLDISFEAGLAPENGIDTLLYMFDEKTDTLRLVIPGTTGPEIVYSFDEYSIAFRQIVKSANLQINDRYKHDSGKEYWIYYHYAENYLQLKLLPVDI
ncbi:MAG: bifunctional nuclease domain-containing protein [Armatimonadota bacterium]